jgi:hypothetical protein
MKQSEPLRLQSPRSAFADTPTRRYADTALWCCGFAALRNLWLILLFECQNREVNRRSSAQFLFRRPVSQPAVQRLNVFVTEKALICSQQYALMHPCRRNKQTVCGIDRF